MNLAFEARQFLRTTRSAILSTFSAKYSAYPFGSVAPFVLNHQGEPVVLISTIAEHTKNIIENPKVSLLVFAGAEDLQANARLTLLGTAYPEEKQDILLRNRYLNYFPEAENYFDMHDFHFYRIQIEHARYIAGFGKMGWSAGVEMVAPANSLKNEEPGIIVHMNEDHADSMRAYCRHYHQVEASEVEMLGIDCDGFDVRAYLNDKPLVLRFNFDAPISNMHEARKALVAMSAQAK